MPGPFRASVTPYMGDIAKACADPSTKWAVLVMGSQMGKTEGCLSLIGQKLDDNPEPILYVGPTQKNVQEKIEPRIMKMIDSSPTLAPKLLRGKASTKTCKRIAGVELNLGWSGSPTELASQPAAMVLIDELDRMKPIKGEGSIVELADVRKETYANSLGVIDSTPTSGTVETYIDEHGFERWRPAASKDIESATWQHWQEGSREEWAVPCPDCGEYFIPRFKLLHWPDGCSTDDVLTEARLTCARCGVLIEDRHRNWMNNRGVFVGPGQWVEGGRAHGELVNRAKRSFWVSGLMSPFSSFGRRAQAWLRAARSKEETRIQAALNTLFGELYQLKGDAPEWQAVKNCALDYRTGTAPEGVQRIFVTVDVQQNRLVFVVRGWGYAFESWGIEAGEIYAGTDTSDPSDACWSALEDLMSRTWNGLPVAKMAIDSNFNTATVDAFVKANASRAMATRGSPTKPTRLFSSRAQEITDRGRQRKTGLIRWTIDHGHFKGWLYERMHRAPDAVGAWHIAKDMGAPGADEPSDDYCKQVTAEVRMVLPSGTERWRQMRKDNHFLDCEYLQAFLAHQQRIGDLPPVGEQEVKPAPQPKPKPSGSWVRRSTRGSWIR